MRYRVVFVEVTRITYEFESNKSLDTLRADLDEVGEDLWFKEMDAYSATQPPGKRFFEANLRVNERELERLERVK